MEESEAREVLYALSSVNIDSPDLESLLKNDIIFNHTFYSLPDGPVRRRLFAVVECFLVKLWQESYFGRKQLEREAERAVATIFDILRNVLPEICFSEVTVWFGGEQLGLKTDSLNNAVAFLSCCWHSAALAVPIFDANTIQDFLKLSTRLIPPSSCLPTVLLAHDERCLSNAVALLYLKTAKIDIPSQLKAMWLFRHTLFSISYDHKVVLDWLCSEMAAVPFVLRFLKMLLEQQNAVDGEQYKSNFSCPQCSERNKKVRLVRSKAAPSNDDLTLRIHQLHGDLPVTTSYTFPKREGEVHLTSSKCDVEEEESGDRQIVICFGRLRNSCIMLQNSNNAPFNVKPIIEIVEKLEKAAIVVDATVQGDKS